MVVLPVCRVLQLGVQTNTASSQRDGAQSCGAGAGRHSLAPSQAAFKENEHLLDQGMERSLCCLSWRREEGKVER